MPIILFITFITLGISQLFYKKGNSLNSNYSHLRTCLFIGLVLGIDVMIRLLLKNPQIKINDVIIYFPIALLYILGIIFGIKGLKTVSLSVATSIRKSYKIIPIILSIIFFKDKISYFLYFALMLIFLGLIMLITNNKKQDIISSLASCVILGVATFVNIIYVDKLFLITQESALISFEIIFFLYAICCYIFLKINKECFSLKDERDRMIAVVLSFISYLGCMYLINSNLNIAIITINMSFVLTLILSKLFLHEKWNFKNYLSYLLIILGIVICSF